MFFRNVQSLIFWFFVILLFSRFSCEKEQVSVLTVLSVSVVDSLSKEPVEGAVIGISSRFSECSLKDTFLTDKDGKATYAFLNETDSWSSEYYSLRIFPKITSGSMGKDIIHGVENSFDFKVNSLTNAFGISVQSEYDSLFVWSNGDPIYLGGASTEICVDHYGLTFLNDEIALYEINENLNFNCKGILNRINYLLIEKYKDGISSSETITLFPAYENFPVLIE